MILRQVRDTAADAELVSELSLAAFAAPSDDPARPPAPAPTPLQLARTRHLARTDPGGCWLAESGGQAVGVVLSMRREGLWTPSLFAVRPSAQGQGIGRLLF
ncbi:GNAT family N-acetyltransferase, partial [Streptomyces althioticus]|uniref:GNAT family N-acetyltransferase n=1 Tax=Streptomyces althioticus TaxID=83380 RepID=UPI0036F4D6A1